MYYQFSGACIIENAHVLKRALITHIDSCAEDVFVDFSNVVEADLSFFQLILAAKTYCDARRKKLRMKSNLPAKFKSLAEWMGLAEIIDPAAFR